MKISFYISYCIMGLLLFSSCADTKNNKNIIGNWKATQWQANGLDLDRNVTTTQFTFDDKGMYSFANNGNVETGSYKVEVNNLFTTAKGKQEIMVKIVKATSDSLVFDMNNGGQMETITFLKN